MNELELFHRDLDSSSWDIEDESYINEQLKGLEEILDKSDDKENLRKANIERQTFHFSKTPHNKLSYRVAGTQTLEDGTQVPFEWPDIRAFEERDFQYLTGRFSQCQNIYAKAEYGLVLYYADKKKDNTFVKELLETLFKLAQWYYKKALEGKEKNHYASSLHHVLSNALFIADARKSVPEIEPLNEQLIKFTFEAHTNWQTATRSIIDFTDFAIEYFKSFVKYVDLQVMLQKNWEIAHFLEDEDRWGVIFIADKSIKLSKKLKKDATEWIKFKAFQYEALATQAIENNNLAAISFIEKALNTYRDLKDIENVQRLEEVYQQYRGKLQLQQFKTVIPQDETSRILEKMKKDIQEGDEFTIVATLFDTPMLRPLSEIKEWSEQILSQNSLTNIIPISIVDKFGNTVQTFETEDEKKEYRLLHTYGNHLQVASQFLMQYIFEALKANKLKASAILIALEKSWLNEPMFRVIDGQQISINYLKTIKPGIISLFNELERWNTEEGYVPNFILSTDNLVLKVEYLLREVCLKLGIATFKSKPKEPDIIMEKTLDDLLGSLEGKLIEDDWFFIKFILTEKVGENLRNRVAHGLLDNTDYGVIYPIYALLCILKLSSYKFSETGD